MKKMTEEERLLSISCNFNSEEEYFDAGEDVGYLLAVLDRRDRRIKALERVADIAREMAYDPPMYEAGRHATWQFYGSDMRILKEALKNLEATHNEQQ